MRVGGLPTRMFFSYSSKQRMYVALIIDEHDNAWNASMTKGVAFIVAKTVNILRKAYYMVLRLRGFPVIRKEDKLF